MFDLFAVAGIFLCGCRHGHMILICDMIRSGELYVHCAQSQHSSLYSVYCRMKYGISIVNRLIDTFGEDIGLAYDIMCTFMKTLSNSSIGSKVKEKQLIGVVPAFHGHAHNCACQVRWHPMHVDGVGTEDFELCEWIFYESNDLATCTRTATPFHRRQEILDHFAYQDLNKHLGIGRFRSSDPSFLLTNN
jgi:hypothetical protein